MRIRGLLVALTLLSGLGFFTARAANVTLRAEDIDSFATTVSISTPTTVCAGPVALAPPIWIRTIGGTRVLDLGAPDPPATDTIATQEVAWSTVANPLPTESAAGSLVAWTTRPTVAPTCGWRLPASVTVQLRTTLSYLTALNVDLLARAGLFACDVGAAAATVVASPPVVPGCRLIASGGATIANGTDRPLSIPIAVAGSGPHVPAGQELRLKVITVRSPVGLPVPVYVGGNPTLRWGYTAATKSQVA